MSPICHDLCNYFLYSLHSPLITFCYFRSWHSPPAWVPPLQLPNAAPLLSSSSTTFQPFFVMFSNVTFLHFASIPLQTLLSALSVLALSTVYQSHITLTYIHTDTVTDLYSFNPAHYQAAPHRSTEKGLIQPLPFLRMQVIKFHWLRHQGKGMWRSPNNLVFVKHKWLIKAWISNNETSNITCNNKVCFHMLWS